jgi:hypothetical protein
MQLTQRASRANTADKIIQKIALCSWKRIEGMVEGSWDQRVNRKVHVPVTRLERSSHAIDVLEIIPIQIEEDPAIFILI